MCPLFRHPEPTVEELPTDLPSPGSPDLQIDRPPVGYQYAALAADGSQVLAYDSSWIWRLRTQWLDAMNPGQWNLGSNERRIQYFPEEPGGRILSLRSTAAGEWGVSKTLDGCVSLWQLPPDRNDSDTSHPPSGRTLDHITFGSSVVRFSPDSSLLAMAGPDVRTTTVADRGEEARIDRYEPVLFEGGLTNFSDCAFTPNGDVVRAIAREGLFSWDRATGEFTHSPWEVGGGMQSAALSEDSSMAAWGTRGGRILAVETSSLEPVQDSYVGDDRVWPVALDPSGHRIAFWCAGRVHVRVVESWSNLATLTDVQTYPSLHFSGDGSSLLVAEACRIRLWNIGR